MGYDRAVCCDYFDGKPPALDFLSDASRSGIAQFASEAFDPAIPRPWRDGYRPRSADWEAIGFMVIDFG